MKETRLLKLLFWCLSPLIFVAFLRIFALVFHFICGTALRILLGAEYDTPVLILSWVAAIGFTIAVMVWLYGQFLRHIVGEESEKVKGEGESKKPHE
jgi:hypothetical protein